MSNVTSQTTDQEVGERCWKEHSTPPPIPYLSCKVFQSFNNDSSQKVALLSFMAIRDMELKNQAVKTFILFLRVV